MANPKRIHIKALKNTSRLRTMICSSRRCLISLIILFSFSKNYGNSRYRLNLTPSPQKPPGNRSTRHTTPRAATFNSAREKTVKRAALACTAIFKRTYNPPALKLPSLVSKSNDLPFASNPRIRAGIYASILGFKRLSHLPCLKKPKETFISSEPVGNEHPLPI